MCMMSAFSVAVRPTPEEVKQRRLHYDEAYYEDRAHTYVTETLEEAVQMYIKDDQAKEDRPDINMKKGEHFFLQRAEIPYVRAGMVSGRG